MAEETTPNEAGEQTSQEAPAAAEAEGTTESNPAAKKPPKAAGDGGEGDKPAPKAKKEKAPALEDKPFADFVQQDYLPALKNSLAEQGIQNLDLTFEKQKFWCRVTPVRLSVGRWSVAGAVDRSNRVNSTSTSSKKIFRGQRLSLIQKVVADPARLNPS